MSERNWTIAGYDNGVMVFSEVVSVDSIAESDVKALLQRLASRHWSEQQVVLASLSSDHREPLLEVSETSDGPFGFTTNPEFPRYYTAILGDVAEEEIDESMVDDDA